MNYGAAGILALALTSGAVFSQDGPLRPPHKLFPWDGTGAPATMKFKPAPGVMLGKFRVVFGETLLAAVREAAGGTILKEGDASEASSSLCYTTPEMRVWINGAGTSAEADVLGILAIPLAKGMVAGKRCPALPDSLRPVVFDHGLALGMSPEQLTAKFGAPSRTRRDVREYQYEEAFETVHEGEKVPCTLFNGLDVRVRNGVVDAIRANLNGSC